jgi:hypothetical protein
VPTLREYAQQVASAGLGALAGPQDAGTAAEVGEPQLVASGAAPPPIGPGIAPEAGRPYSLATSESEPPALPLAPQASPNDVPVHIGKSPAKPGTAWRQGRAAAPLVHGKRMGVGRRHSHLIAEEQPRSTVSKRPKLASGRHWKARGQAPEPVQLEPVLSSGNPFYPPILPRPPSTSALEHRCRSILETPDEYDDAAVWLCRSQGRK